MAIFQREQLAAFLILPVALSVVSGCEKPCQHVSPLRPSRCCLIGWVSRCFGARRFNSQTLTAQMFVLKTGTSCDLGHLICIYIIYMGCTVICQRRNPGRLDLWSTNRRSGAAGSSSEDLYINWLWQNESVCWKTCSNTAQMIKKNKHFFQHIRTEKVVHGNWTVIFSWREANESTAVKMFVVK